MWGLKVVGDDVIKRFGDLPTKVGRELDNKFKDLGLQIVGYAKSIAPYRTYKKEPANHIHFRDGLSSEVRPAGAGVSKLVVGSSARHTRFVEDGTRKWVGKPTIRPAIQRFLPEVFNAIREAVIKAL